MKKEREKLLQKRPMLGQQLQPPPPPPPPPVYSQPPPPPFSTEDIKSALSNLKKPPQTPKQAPSMTPRDLMFQELKQRVAQRNPSSSSKTTTTTTSCSSTTTLTCSKNKIELHDESFITICDTPKTVRVLVPPVCKTPVSSYSKSHVKTVSTAAAARGVGVALTCPNARLESIERDLTRVKRKFEELEMEDSDECDGDAVDSDDDDSRSVHVGSHRRSTFKRRRKSSQLNNDQGVDIGGELDGEWRRGVSAVAVAAIAPVVGFAFGFFMALSS
ncbi:UNVERIFIED_CONTAM: hypothetical protein HDU68_008003 [Siphonaria sp. JEL0065]|nr:hypothetical protein HDU68_008003 [Siphonaria sp. JEL0065]